MARLIRCPLIRCGSVLKHLLALVLLVCISRHVPCAHAEDDYSNLDRVNTPDKDSLFIEDDYHKAQEKKRTKDLKQRRQSFASKKQSDLPFDINATKLNYNQQTNSLEASGGFTIGYPSGLIEADQGEFNLSTHEASMRGDVKIDDASADILADLATFNLDKGTGEMENTTVTFADGNYKATAERTEKLTGDVFEFENVAMTTCSCPSAGDTSPWTLSGDKGSVEREGYGHLYNATLSACGTPVFYLPYLIFPVKTERQSGFLRPTFGTGRNSGFNFELPLYLSIDGSSDATITTVYDQHLRLGVDSEYRRAFSSKHYLNGGLLYLDESVRGNDLMGTNIDDLSDPTHDTNRFGSYANYSLSTDVMDNPVQVIGTGKWVSDDLLLREYEKADIGPYNSRFVTSTGTLRTTLFDDYEADLSTEYNQALVDDDDFILQRLPQASLEGTERFNPFPENPLGLKLIATNQATAVRFDRTKSYDGSRFEAYERLKMPYYFKNYLEGALSFDARATQYDLDETNEIILSDVVDPVTGETTTTETVNPLKKSTDRVVPGVNYNLSTVVERVFSVEKDSNLAAILDIGHTAREEGVQRVKHTIEPGVKYRYVPYVEQKDTPLFDAQDHLSEKSLLTFDLMQRLFGSYASRNDYVYGIEEAAPDVNELEDLPGGALVDDSLSYGLSSLRRTPTSTLPKNNIRELMTFKLSESFDVLESQKNIDPEQAAWSDLGASLMFLPNSQLRFGGGANLDPETYDFSSYDLKTQLIGVRGDEIRGVYSFIDDSIQQLEAGLQVVLTERVKLGYYARYDQLNSEFIDNRVGLRFSSSCHCWNFDIDVRDQSNPDETKLSFTLTLLGLGEFGNTLLTKEKKPGM